jgi:hypothetical protein
VFVTDVIQHSYNCVIRLLCERFQKHKALALDLHLLDPRNFHLVDSMSLNLNSFCKLAENITKYFPEFDLHDFRSELVTFSASWPKFNEDIHESYEKEFQFLVGDEAEENLLYVDLESALGVESEFECDQNSKCPDFAKCETKCQSDKGCPLCVLRHLEKYNMFSSAFKNLWLAYKYVLTISIGQVECERTFSKMKYLKNRLRSTLCEKNFQNLSLMYCEKRLLNIISNENVIDRLCCKSDELNKLLSIK